MKADTQVYYVRGPEGSVGNMRRRRWKKGKSASRRRERKKRDAHTGGPCERGGAAKGDEDGGVRWETRTEKERKDVKQSNDEMHFPPGVHPSRPPSRPLGVHPEGNVERNVKNREEE